MDSWQVAILALVALFVGITIPLVLQARSTLREIAWQLRATGERLRPALDDAQVTVQRFRSLTEGLDDREGELAEIVDTAGQLAATLQRMRGASRVATVAAAGVAAAVKAYREAAEAGEEEARADSMDGELEIDLGAPNGAGERRPDLRSEMRGETRFELEEQG